MKKNSIRFLTESAVIAAIYVVMTFVSASLNLAYNAVQFRVSEVLTILPIFTPAAVPGLAIGCFISNLSSPLGPVDWVFGTGATLLAAVITRMLREVEIKNIPLLAMLSPVIVNAVIIGFEIACLSTDDLFAVSNLDMTVFLASMVSVGIGQLVVCVGFGIPMYLSLKKLNFNKLGAR